jgi:glucose-1-phosphate thymidylyltransferase
MKAIITAGGRGTRMRPLTFSSNKHLIPLANKPLIFYAIETVAAAGIKEIGINYNPGQLEELEGVLGGGERWGVKFTYILQEKPRGLADIVRVSRDFVGEDRFFMHLGDNIFYGGIEALVKRFAKSRANGLVTILHHRENWRLGVPYFDKRGRLVKYLEKPAHPPHDWAIPGLYFFDSKVFECFEGRGAIRPSARGELEISSPYQWLIDHGCRVETKEFKGVWKDPGKFDDWLETNKFILGEKLGKKVEKSRGIKLRNSVLVGPVIIGAGSVIEEAIVGPYVSIGDNCRVRRAKVEETIFCDDVVVDSPGKALKKCLIGGGTSICGNSCEGMELFLGNQCGLKL